MAPSKFRLLPCGPHSHHCYSYCHWDISWKTKVRFTATRKQTFVWPKQEKALFSLSCCPQVTVEQNRATVDTLNPVNGEKIKKWRSAIESVVNSKIKQEQSPKWKDFSWKRCWLWREVEGQEFPHRVALCRVPGGQSRCTLEISYTSWVLMKC